MSQRKVYCLLCKEEKGNNKYLFCNECNKKSWEKRFMALQKEYKRGVSPLQVKRFQKRKKK